MMIGKEYINWETIEEIVDKLCIEVQERYPDVKSVFGVKRGGLIPAVMVSHKLNLPLTEYPDPQTLIIDDICDSGDTVLTLKDLYNSPIATLYYRINVAHTAPDIYGIAITHNNFLYYPWERLDAEPIQDYLKNNRKMNTISEPRIPFIDEVEEFNKTFNKPVNYEPTIPEEKEWKFVYDFIQEELEEYKEACEQGDIVGILDALCDITYVSLANGALLHGLKSKIPQAYAEVQASNMSKSCATEEEARKTAEFRAQELNVETHYEQVGDRWVVYRSSDRKVLKSLSYFKPDLKQFFTQKELEKINK